MKLRYMMDSVASGSGYEEVGVWITDGKWIYMFYKPSKKRPVKERVAESKGIIKMLQEYDIKKIPANFMEYHSDQRSVYTGMFGDIIETTKFSSVSQAAQNLLAGIDKETLRRFEAGITAE